jgi:hypothetical protein
VTRVRRHYDVDTAQPEEQQPLLDVVPEPLAVALAELGARGGVRLSIVDPQTVMVTCDACQTRIQLEHRSSSYAQQLEHLRSHLKECRS